MKKWTVVFGLVVAMAVLATGVAYAEGEEPPYGGLRGRRLNADPQHVQLELLGGIHDDLLAAVSEATGLSVTDLESRIEAGETLAAILEAEGYDPEILAEIMYEVRQAALQELVDAGCRCVMFYFIQRMDAEVFKPADHIDPKYGDGLRNAVEEGLELLAYDVVIDLNGIKLNRKIPIKLGI